MLSVISVGFFVPSNQVILGVSNSSYCTVDTITDSVRQHSIDSIENLVYSYYDTLFKGEQIVNEISHVRSEIFNLERDMLNDSITLQHKINAFITDTVLTISDSTSFDHCIKEFVKGCLKSDVGDTVMNVQKEVYVKCILQLPAKRLLTGKDTLRIKEEMEELKIICRGIVQKKKAVELSWKTLADLEKKHLESIKLKNCIEDKINALVQTEATKYYSKDTSLIQLRTYRKKRYIVFRLPVKQDSLELQILNNNSNAPRTLKAAWDILVAQKKMPVFIMNAGMYRDDYTPQGLLVENFKLVSQLDTDTSKGKTGNFYLHPNGVFYLKEGSIPYIKTLQGFIKDENSRLKDKSVRSGKVVYATQSGPMLVIDNSIHKAFNPVSRNVNIRNGVGIHKSKDVTAIYMAISEEKVNFHEFASFFKDVLGCQNALYLDGVVSRLYTSVGSNKMGVLDNKMGLGPVITVIKRKRK